MVPREWIKGPGTRADVISELRKEVETDWGQGYDIDAQIKSWADNRMDAAREHHITTENPQILRAREPDAKSWNADDEAVVVELEVDRKGQIHGHVPEGVQVKPINDHSAASYDSGSERTGLLIEARRPIELTVDLERDVPYKDTFHITLTSKHAGNVTVRGNGDGDARHIGPGPGDAVRKGRGNGSAIREGGEGNAVRLGPGFGHAARSYRGTGYALRSEEGRGDAIRSDYGDGTATRCGTGDGNAHRTGSGRGDAIVRDEADGSARVSGAVEGNATREGTGTGDAVVSGHAVGEATVGSEARGNAHNTSTEPGNAINRSSREGDARREGEGGGNAVRTGAGLGNAIRGGTARGHAWRAGSGTGDAWNVSSSPGNSGRTGPGSGQAVQQGRFGSAWNGENPTKPPYWVEELGEEMRRPSAGPTEPRSPENTEAWIITDINGDVHPSSGIFESQKACQEYIHEHIDGESQREYGMDSMFSETRVPAPREAVMLIHAYADKLETDRIGAGSDAAQEWDAAVRGAAAVVATITPEERNVNPLIEAPTTPSTPEDHRRLRALTAAAEDVHATRTTEVDPVGPERDLIAALEYGKARERIAEIVRTERDGPNEFARKADHPGTTTPASAPPRAAGAAAEASKTQDERTR